MDNTNIGQRIKELRIKQNMTQKELAEKSGLSEITIRKYESNERKPKIENIRNIAAALKVSMNTFLDGHWIEYNQEIIEDFSKYSVVKEPCNNYEVENTDSDIRRIQRARKAMPEKERKKMMDILEAAFEDYFSDDYENNDLDE